MSTRRKFLAIMGAAPVAVPIAAKEASAKMGLLAPIGAPPEGGPLSSGLGGCSVSGDDTGTYLANMLGGIDRGEEDKEFHRDAKYGARVLDPDLASLRSISPSFAYVTQRQRTFNEYKRMRRERILQDIAMHAKRSFRP